MNKKSFRSECKRLFSSIALDKRTTLAIHNHFGLSNYQMLVLSWFKGLWTGILFSLAIHYFIVH